MQLKRAIWISVLAYIATFAAGTLVTIITADITNLQKVSLSYWIATIISSVVITILFSLWYLRNKKVKPSIKEGAYLGVTLILVSLIMDVILMLLYVALGGQDQFLSYYSNPWFYITIAIIFLTSVVVSHIKGR